MKPKILIRYINLILSHKQQLILGISMVLFVLLFQSCSITSIDDKINSPLTLMYSIPLQNVSGRIDHMTFDPKRNWICVAALGNNSMEVANLKSRKEIHSITGLSGPQGIHYISRNNTVIVTNGNNGNCDIYNTDSYQKLTSINLGADADNVLYDSTTNRIYVGYGYGGIAIIDAVTFIQLAEIKLPGHPESFQLDNNNLYVNIPDVHQIEVIDLGNNSVKSVWNVEDASSNFPMALDKTNHRLFVGCRAPSKLLVLDSENGRTITILNIDSDTDDVYYDSSSKQIYVSCGDGFVDIIKQIDADTYQTVSKISTGNGARTSLFIPQLNQLIVAAPAQSGNQAQLLIYGKQ